jgi:hypothetical protein
VRSHRLIQPINRHAAERAMTDRQSGTHARLPTRQVIVLSD